MSFFRVAGHIFLWIVAAGAPASAGESPVTSVIVSGGWEYRWGDSPVEEDGRLTWAVEPAGAEGWTRTDVLEDLPGRGENRGLWLRTVLPDWGGRDPSLYLHSVDIVFESFLDGELIYGFGELVPGGDVEFVGWPWHAVPLPDDFGGKILAFRIQSSIGDIGIVHDPVLASGAHHVRTILRRDLDRVVLAFMMGFVAVMSFAFAVLWRERRSAFALGVFSLLMGVWTFSETELKQFIWHAPLWWTYLGLAAIYLAPAALLAVVEETHGIGFRRVLKWMRWSFAAYALAALGLSALGVFDLPGTIRPFNVLVVIGLGVGMASLLMAAIRRNPEALIFTAGMSVLGVCVLVDVVVAWTTWQPPITPWGLLFFVLSLCLIMRYRFVAVHRRSVLDGLTGVANRYQFDALLELEWHRAQRDAGTLSLIMVDIDFFKNYNDTYGHLAGDECLKRVADVLRSVTRRSGDVVARYGGEEFAILLPGMGETAALLVAERMRTALEGLGIEHAGSSVADSVTTSAGVATMDKGRPISREELVQRADEALYRAKREGRNRTCGGIA